MFEVEVKADAYAKYFLLLAYPPTNIVGCRCDALESAAGILAAGFNLTGKRGQEGASAPGFPAALGSVGYFSTGSVPSGLPRRAG